MNPNGFARVVNADGSITEGMFTPDGKRNGWCITFDGQKVIFYYGWYLNDKRVGNY